MATDRHRETGTHLETGTHRADEGDGLFHDLSQELKEEINEIYYGEQPVKPQADLIVRRHVMGIIILLFGLVALILLISMGVLGLHGPLHR
ncbi:MAG TPA: hypothetical protein VHZ28_11375 [Terracidiphilus sp.]|jgi:hypothetical protein|nr:hypothetical protein [Terracidiphilus sp.]